MNPKHTESWMLPFAEAKALMNEYCGTITWVGSVPTLEETQYLAEETDEIAEEEEEDRLTTRPTRRVGSGSQPHRREQEMEKEKKPEQQQEPSPISAAVVHRDQLVAELKAMYPGITDAELEAYGV